MYLRYLTFLFLILPVLAQYPQSMFNGDPMLAFRMSGAPADHLATVPANGPGFSQALRIRTPESPQTNPWDIRIISDKSSSALRPVNSGDTGLAVFYARSVESRAGRSFGRLVLERNGSPYNKAVNWVFSVGAEWTLVEIPFVLDASYQPGEYNLHVWVTFEPQVLEIGGLSVRNFGPSVPFTQLPISAWPNYDGHATDAPWRAAAASRIDEYRKSEIVVRVRDAEGRAIPGSKVTVRMKRHAFPFGTAIAADPLVSDRDYQRVFLENFNSAVVENALKWPQWEQNRARALNALDWLAANGIEELRGHNVVWPTWRYLPADVEGLKADTTALRNRVNGHIDDVMQATRGKLLEWDVINEPVHERDLQTILGDAEIYAWMRRAAQNDPDARLYINDYDILTNGGVNKGTQDRYFELLRGVIENGAPIHGAGLQGHFGNNVTPPEQVLAILDRFAALGLDLKVTEFDINTTDEKLQADYTRDFLTVVFSHRAVDGFLMWGFWEGRHWKPEAAMFRRDWTPKPSAQVWRDLVYSQWWTNAAGQTGDDGVFRVRGFHGDYDVTVETGEGEKTMPLRVSPSSAEAVLDLTATPRRAQVPLNGVVNAASFAGGPVAPGEIVTIFGTDFGSMEVKPAGYDSSLGLHRKVAETRVLFDGRESPIIYTFRNQMSVIVPYGVAGSTRMQVEYLGLLSNEVELSVAGTAPGIFCLNQGGTGQAVALNFDGGRSTLNGVSNRVKRGDTLTIFITGEGQVTPPIGEGLRPAEGQWPAPERPLRVLFGDRETEAQFTGLIFAGVTQINVPVPLDAPTGDAVPLLVDLGGIRSPAGVTVAIE